MRFSLILILSCTLISCSLTKCRQKKDEKTFVEQVENLPNFKSKGPKSIKAGDLETVRVYKADGTRQCEGNRPTPITELKEQLESNGIRVLKVEHTSDGVMHTQSCGSETGRVYVFDIQKLNLPKALKFGYKNFGNL
ncbi:MAG: hypothetical protein KDD37_07515 [Bdellovibrionales bacterium]|nr:hypothetical protein [Bdellovibrionales bacterium]